MSLCETCAEFRVQERAKVYHFTTNTKYFFASLDKQLVEYSWVGSPSSNEYSELCLLLCSG